jgi:hypothetical protein
LQKKKACYLSLVIYFQNLYIIKLLCGGEAQQSCLVQYYLIRLYYLEGIFMKQLKIRLILLITLLLCQYCFGETVSEKVCHLILNTDITYSDPILLKELPDDHVRLFVQQVKQGQIYPSTVASELESFKYSDCGITPDDFSDIIAAVETVATKEKEAIDLQCEKAKANIAESQDALDDLAWGDDGHQLAMKKFIAAQSELAEALWMQWRCGELVWRQGIKPPLLGQLVRETLQDLAAQSSTKEKNEGHKASVWGIPYPEYPADVRHVVEEKFSIVDLSDLFPGGVSEFLSSHFIDFFTDTLVYRQEHNRIERCPCSMATEERRVELIVRLVNHITLFQDKEFLSREKIVYTSFCSGSMFFDLSVLRALINNGSVHEIIFYPIDAFYETEPISKFTSIELLREVAEAKACRLEVVPYPRARNYISAVKEGEIEQSDIFVMVDPGETGTGETALAHGEFLKLVDETSKRGFRGFSIIYILDLNIIENISMGPVKLFYLKRDVEGYSTVKQKFQAIVRGAT